MSRSRQKKKNDNGQLGMNNVTPGTVICVTLQFYAVRNSFMVFFFYFYFFIFSATLKHCPGHRDRYEISGTIQDDPGHITCMALHFKYFMKNHILMNKALKFFGPRQFIFQ